MCNVSVFQLNNIQVSGTQSITPDSHGSKRSPQITTALKLSDPTSILASLMSQSTNPTQQRGHNNHNVRIRLLTSPPAPSPPRNLRLPGVNFDVSVCDHLHDLIEGPDDCRIPSEDWLNRDAPEPIGDLPVDRLLHDVVVGSVSPGLVCLLPGLDARLVMCVRETFCLFDQENLEEVPSFFVSSPLASRRDLRDGRGNVGAGSHLA
jgi:hypothetical protein